MEINLGELPFDVDFHPSDSLVATGLINGYLLLYRYGSDAEPQRLLKVRAHKKSCRAARFISEGRAIVTGSPDCSILATDVETGAKIAHLENAHSAPINRIINLTDATIASGDDAGCVKVIQNRPLSDRHKGNDAYIRPPYPDIVGSLLMHCDLVVNVEIEVWDTRQQSCCNTFEVHEEYISDMTFASDSSRLLATSGDGTLSVCSLRSNKVQGQSEFCEDEPLSVVIMKNGRKVLCGTQTGTLLLYSWGFFKDCSDRFVDLCPNPVDALLKLDEDRVVTGSYNGIISLVGILPNRVIQPIAEHSDYPVERLAFSHDQKYLGSISHDQMLKLWDMDELLQGSTSVTTNGAAPSDSDDDGDSDGMDVDSNLPSASRKTKTKNAGKASSSSTGSFFADL